MKCRSHFESTPSQFAFKDSFPMLSMMQGVLGLASGVLVGFSLGLVGGGGSIVAVPLMVYVVGVPPCGDRHRARLASARRGAQYRVCGGHYCGGALYAGA
jgi:hypothetical protein